MKRIYFVLLILTLCLGCTNKRTANNENADMENGVPIIAEAEITTAYVSPSRGLNLRSEPGSAGSRIKLLPQNTELTILERSEQRERIDGLFDYWYKVDEGDEIGWVYGGYISSVPRSHSVELKEVNEFERGIAYRNRNNKNNTLDQIDTYYLLTLIDNQVLCYDLQRDLSGNSFYDDENIQYYLVNYLTGEVTYRFEEPIKLWGDFFGDRGNLIFDQYGHYLFLEKEGAIVLFDVQEKRELSSGEPIKRSEYVYYTELSDRGEIYRIIKYNLITRQSTDLNMSNLNLRIYLDRTLLDIENNQLLLYDNSEENVLQLDDSMTEVLSSTRSEISRRRNERTEREFVRINNEKYVGFSSALDVPVIAPDVFAKFFVKILDNMGITEHEYKDLIFTHAISHVHDYRTYFFLVSPDKQYILLFNNESGSDPIQVYVYQILYD